MQFHTFHGITSFFFQTASRIIKEKKFQETATSLFQDLGVSTKSARSVIDLVSSAANIILEAVGHVYGSLPLHFVRDHSFSYTGCRLWNSLPQDGMLVVFSSYEVGETGTK